MLSTNTDKIDWSKPENGDRFDEAFTINMDAIYFYPNTDCVISFKKPDQDNDYDEDEDKYSISSIFFQLPGSKKSVEYKSPVRLFINPEFTTDDKMNSDGDTITINAANVGEDTYIFKYDVKNKELTRSLQAIIDLLEKSEHLGISDYDSFINKFDDLLIDNDLGYIMSVHAEMMSAVLIRDKATGQRLDFSKEHLDDYDIMRVTNAVMEGPIATSFAFERLNEQLIDPKTYQKDSKSIMDVLYE